MNHGRLTTRSLILTASLKLTRCVVDTASSLASAVSRGLDDASDALLYVESHQARKYELLTGYDLSTLTEQPGVYTDARAELIDAETEDD